MPHNAFGAGTDAHNRGGTRGTPHGRARLRRLRVAAMDANGNCHVLHASLITGMRTRTDHFDELARAIKRRWRWAKVVALVSNEVLGEDVWAWQLPSRAPLSGSVERAVRMCVCECAHARPCRAHAP